MGSKELILYKVNLYYYSKIYFLLINKLNKNLIFVTFKKFKNEKSVSSTLLRIRIESKNF